MKKSLTFVKETVSVLTEYRGGIAGTRSVCGDVACPVMTETCPTSAGCPTNGCDMTNLACRTIDCPTVVDDTCYGSIACNVTAHCETMTAC